MSGTGLKSTFNTQLTDVEDDDRDGVGTHRYEAERWYKYVKYDDGAGNVSIAAGDFLAYNGVTGYEGSVVTGDTSAQSTLPAGLSISAIGNGQYGWIQIKGQAVVAAARLATAVADGDLLKLGAADKTAGQGNTAGDKVLGVCLDESAGKLTLDCVW